MKKKMTMGEKISNLRKQKGMTQEFLAEQLKVSVGYISCLENEKINKPSVYTINKIAKLFGVKVDTLVNDNDDNEKRCE